MRTTIEIQERKNYLEWFRKDLVYFFQTTPLSRYWYTVASAYFRTLDNEIDMLRWVLGEVENTWEDNLSQWDGLLDLVQAEPQTCYPHLPLHADYHTYWGQLPRPACRYFFGPDAPKDDQTFDFSQVQDPRTWNRTEFLAHHRYPRPGLPRFFTGQVENWSGNHPAQLAYELGEGPNPRLVNAGVAVGNSPTTARASQ